MPYLQSDTLLAAARFPKFLDVGGNQGKVNTFAGVKVEDISGGAYNLQKLKEGNNLACFAMQFAAQASPDLIKCSGVLGSASSATSALSSQLTSSLAGLNCPQ